MSKTQAKTWFVFPDIHFGDGGPKGEMRFDLVEFIDWYKQLVKGSDNGER